MIRTSEQINELSDAFTKAQAKFGAAIKASQNPAFRSKYADLASVIDATLEHLNAEGIGVMQHPALEFKGDLAVGREAFVTVTTRLQHKTGQWMESDVTIPAVQRDRFDAQSVGSAITYACRYALRSICTVPQADDDANEASGIGSREAAQSVGKAKVEELTAKKDGKAAYVTSLFFTWFDASQTAEITGDRDLMKTNETLLKPLKLGGKLVATAEQLENLKYALETRGVPFTQLKEPKSANG